MVELQSALDDLYLFFQSYFIQLNNLWLFVSLILSIALLSGGIWVIKRGLLRCKKSSTLIPSITVSSQAVEDLELIRLLVLLPDVAKKITSAKDVAHLYTVLVEQVHLLLPFYQHISLLIPETNLDKQPSLILKSSFGLKENCKVRLPMDRGMVALAIDQNMILWRDELEDRFGRQRAVEDLENGIDLSSVAVPISLNGELFACLTLAGSSQVGERVSEKRLLSILADLAGISFSHVNQRLYLNQFNSNLKQMVEEKVAKLRETEQRLNQVEQLAIFGELVATLAHDIKTPLAFILGEAQWAQEIMVDTDFDRNSLKNSLEIIQKNSARLQGDIQNLLQRIRLPEMSLESVSLVQVLSEITQMVKRTAENRGINIIQKFSEQDLVMDGYPTLLRHAFMNLISNAFESMTEGGTIEIQAIRGSDASKITIRDTGKGISAEELPQIFKLFFSRKEGGTGLGLSSVKRIIESQHHGKITVSSELGRGSCFTVELPNKGRGLL